MVPLPFAAVSPAFCTASRCIHPRAADGATRLGVERFRHQPEAMVVTTEPGGPHRIIECGLPSLEGETQRLSRPEKMTLADHLVERLRPQDLGKRSRRFPLAEQIAPHFSPLGRRRFGSEAELGLIDLRVTPPGLS